MTQDEMLVLGRIAERLLICIFGGMSLWMGWRLFMARTKLASDQVAQFSFRQFVIKLQRVAPGIFFVVFGAVILSFSILNPMRSSNGLTNVSYLETFGGRSLEEIQALNFLVQIARMPADDPISRIDRTTLTKKAAAIEKLRNRLLLDTIGEGRFAIWSRYRADPAGMPPSAKAIFDDVQRMTEDVGRQGG